MTKDKHNLKFLFAGGGTGGHLFPAIAVAEKIKMISPSSEILFVGTKSKIEGRVIPKLGYRFKSVWIKGFSRKFDLENILFPVKLIVSIIQSLVINLRFKPKVAIGSGGYASGPAIFGSSLMGARVILLEQNSYPGITTRLLERFADEIHISFEDSKKYFKEKSKLFLTGNPVRENLTSLKKEEALAKFKLDDSKKTLLVLGGSLGAASINEAVVYNINFFLEKDIQVIWQTGSNYYDMHKNLSSESIRVNAFIDEMNWAYSACDMLLARAGATTIAELLTLAIPAILVPSPNVAANHQYYNAKSLSEKKAAVLVEDKSLKEKLAAVIGSLIFDEGKLAELRNNAKAISKPYAAEVIARNAINYANAV